MTFVSSRYSVTPSGSSRSSEPSTWPTRSCAAEASPTRRLSSSIRATGTSRVAASRCFRSKRPPRPWGAGRAVAGANAPTAGCVAMKGTSRGSGGAPTIRGGVAATDLVATGAAVEGARGDATSAFAIEGSGAGELGSRRSSAASSLASWSPLEALAMSRPRPSTTRSIASVSSGVARRLPSLSSTSRSSSRWARRLTRIMPTMPAAPFIVCASRKIPSMAAESSGADSSASSPDAMRSRWPLASSTNSGRNSSSSSPVSNPAGF